MHLCMQGQGLGYCIGSTLGSTIYRVPDYKLISHTPLSESIQSYHALTYGAQEVIGYPRLYLRDPIG